MIKEIRMPNAGQTTDTAVIYQWKVNIGDTVERGDILLEAETDKTVLPVESYASGIVIDIFAGEGDTVEGGDTICLIGDEKDKENYTKSKPDETALPEQPTPAIESNVSDDDFIPIMKETIKETPIGAAKSKYPAMPNSKRLAKELGIDLEKITPSNHAYITRHDVLAFSKAHAVDSQDFEILPMTGMRKTIARRMTESVNTIPTFQITVSVDMQQAIDLVKHADQAGKTKIKYNDIIAKAISIVAREFPLINARYESDEIHIYNHTNIGIAVGVDEGLLVPVIKKVDTLSLTETAITSSMLIEKARNGTLTSDEMGNGSITISNLGMFGVDQFSAIVNPPESAILAIGKIATKPVWKDNTYIPVQMMSITGSFDHRIIDGVYAARVMNALSKLIENPLMMLL